MKQLEVPVMDWTDAERRDLGLLVLELIEKSTNLIETYGPRRDLVRATEEVLALIKAKPPRPFPARRLPKLVEPGGWQSIVRNGEDLVRCRYRGDRSHLTEDSLAGAKHVLTILEKQEIEVDPWMLRCSGRRGTASCRCSTSAVRRSQQNRGTCQRRKRLKIQETLDQSTAVAGGCVPRALLRQPWTDLQPRPIRRAPGPRSHEGVGVIQAWALSEAFERCWLLRQGILIRATASGQSGFVGRKNLGLISAIAERPLDLMDQWKDAKTRGSSCSWPRQDGQRTSSALSGVPIRYDQTCSGLGIIGMLTRDAELCRLTNCIGTTRKDIYQAVADDLSLLVEKDLHDVDMELSQHAEKWLAIGIDRKLVKPPIVASIYGSRLHGTCNYLTDFLKQREPGAELEEWEREYTWPAIYLARRLHLVMHAKLRSALEIEKWFRESSRKTVRTQHFFRWTSPRFPAVVWP